MVVREKWSLRYLVGPRSIQNIDEYFRDAVTSSAKSGTKRLTRTKFRIPRTEHSLSKDATPWH